MERGSYVLICGPNGSGKTTLLETILGLLKPRRGKVYLLGHDVSKEGHKARKRCSYLPQDVVRPAWEPFSVKEVVLMGLSPLRPMGHVTEEDVEEAYRVMEMLGIAELAEIPFGRLSGGQQQRAMLARALLRKPEVLLLDEPFSSQDEDSRRYIAGELLPSLNRAGVTILLVSHERNLELRGLSRVVYMNSGRIVRVEDLR